MERVKWGLIGLGLIGTAHARTLAKIEECDLVALSDVDERHAETAAKLGINFYRDYQEMVTKESLHGAIIATPNHLHVPIKDPVRPANLSVLCDSAWEAQRCLL